MIINNPLNMHIVIVHIIKIGSDVKDDLYENSIIKANNEIIINAIVKKQNNFIKLSNIIILTQ